MSETQTQPETPANPTDVQPVDRNQPRKRKSLKGLYIKILEAEAKYHEELLCRAEEELSAANQEITRLKFLDKLKTLMAELAIKTAQNREKTFKQTIKRLDSQSLSLLVEYPLEKIFENPEDVKQYETFVKELQRMEAIELMLTKNRFKTLTIGLCEDYFDVKYTICVNCKKNGLEDTSIQPCNDGQIRCTPCCEANCSKTEPEVEPQPEIPAATELLQKNENPS